MNSERKKKLKVVADTNILISALHFGGEAEIFLGMAASRLLHLFLSKYILWEIKMVLLNKFGWSEEQAKAAQTSLIEIAKIVNPKRSVSAVKTDEADNRILECALEAHADVLVTNDKRHLLPLRSFRGIKIMALKEFLTKFRPGA